MSSQSEAAFDGMLRTLVASISADTLAEELSIESLRDVGRRESRPQRLARCLGIGHIFCDPDRGERAKLQIRDDNEIRVSASWQQLSEDWARAEVAASRTRREEEWLRRLLGGSGRQVIFICGANHVATFAEMAARRGCRIVIAHEDWVSN